MKGINYFSAGAKHFFLKSKWKKIFIEKLPPPSPAQAPRGECATHTACGICAHEQESP
jgi:hypothetical protein